MSVPIDGNTGYFLEVDLEYSSHLHDLHNDYLQAHETMIMKEDKLSPYMQELRETLNITGSEKLVPNLHPKDKYILHYRNLQFYINHGMILKKLIEQFDSTRLHG